MGKQDVAKVESSDELDIKLLAYGQALYEQGKITEAELAEGAEWIKAQEGEAMQPEPVLDTKSVVAALRELLDRAEPLLACHEPSRGHQGELRELAVDSYDLSCYLATARGVGEVLEQLWQRLGARSYALAEVYGQEPEFDFELQHSVSISKIVGDSELGKQLMRCGGRSWHGSAQGEDGTISDEEIPF